MSLCDLTSIFVLWKHFDAWANYPFGPNSLNPKESTTLLVGLWSLLTDKQIVNLKGTKWEMATFRWSFPSVIHCQMATQRKDRGCTLTVNLQQILTSTVTLVIFGEEQMGAAGACQKCSIENVNKQIEKKISLFNVCLVGGGVTEWGASTFLSLSHYQGMRSLDYNKKALMPHNRDKSKEWQSDNCLQVCFVSY